MPGSATANLPPTHPDSVPSRSLSIEVEVIDDRIVIHDAGNDLRTFLNPSASFVFGLCDGARTVREIAAAINEHFPDAGPDLEDVLSTVRRMCEDGVLTFKSAASIGEEAGKADAVVVTTYQESRGIHEQTSGQTRRAIVCFIEERPQYLIQQALALRESWLYVESPDTDLVVMGPPAALAYIPDDVVKIEQRSVADDPEWFGYRYANAISCLNGAGAGYLDRYSHILHTDVDTFITPAWNKFYPSGFVCGEGGYAERASVQENIRDISAEFGLTHRGLTNTGATWYGPTAMIRRLGALTAMMVQYIYSRNFITDKGKWPGWYHAVTLLYAAEIAINHLIPGAAKTLQLDCPSTSDRSTLDHAHIHCWHGEEKFSKHSFLQGKYSAEDTQELNLEIIRDFAMEMSFRSLDVTKVRPNPRCSAATIP